MGHRLARRVMRFGSPDETAFVSAESGANLKRKLMIPIYRTASGLQWPPF